MKTLWKVLGITALAATLVPYRVNKDEESETTVIDALLWQAIHRPSEGSDKGQVDINLGFKSPLQTKREESTLFADDEPEAAVVTAAEPEGPADDEDGVTEDGLKADIDIEA